MRTIGLLVLLVVTSGGAARADNGSAISAKDAQALGLPDAVADVLRTRRWRETPAGFRIIALSHIADGCATRAGAHPDEARRCVAEALAQARALQPRGFAPGRPDPHGVHASHLNLILGAQDAVGGPHDADLHARLSQALAARSLAEPTHHVPSLPGVSYRWPADQSATLAGLRRFDRAHAQDLGGPAIEAWRRWLAAHATVDGLPWSEATGSAGHARLPRGCALAFSIRYVAEFDPDLAASWWRLFRQRYLVDRLLLVGFREWPPDRELPADVDSGPIVHGVGAAATAFAQAAARSVGDGILAARLDATSAIIGQAARADRALAAVADSTLAASILFHGRSPVFPATR